MIVAHPPAPDPAPGGRAPVRIVAYNYTVPAADPVTHKRIPGLWFECHVTVSGRRRCILFST